MSRSRNIALPAMVLLATALVAAGCGAYGSIPQPDPDVRGGLPEFAWIVDENGPSQELPALDSAQVAATAGRLALALDAALADAFPVRLVALFPTEADAERHAQAIRETLAASAAWFAMPANVAARAALHDPSRLAPLSNPERETLLGSAVPARDRGYGWGGETGAADEAVATIGPLLIVTGIEADFVDDVPDEHPLVTLLDAFGGVALLEGDVAGDGGVVADVACRPRDGDDGATLRDLVGDSIEASRFHAVPPWIAAPTDREALARATVRRWRTAASRAIDDPEFRRYLERLTDAVGDESRYEAIADEMEAWINRRSADFVEGEVDPGTLALIAAPPQTYSGPEYASWLREIGERIGQLPLEEHDGGYLGPAEADAGRIAWSGTARLHDGRLEIAGLSFGRFSVGGLEMIAWLGDQGCQDMRIGLVDASTAYPD